MSLVGIIEYVASYETFEESTNLFYGQNIDTSAKQAGRPLNAVSSTTEVYFTSGRTET